MLLKASRQAHAQSWLGAPGCLTPPVCIRSLLTLSGSSLQGADARMAASPR